MARLRQDESSGLPTNTQEYWEKRPSLQEAFARPQASEVASEIYSFIEEVSVYTINRGGGMGLDVKIAPDMLKVKEYCEQRGVDILPYEDYVKSFVIKESKQEQKNRE